MLCELINQRLITKLILLLILHIYNILTDLCSTMACGHLCVNAKSGPRCMCAEGFQLAADGKNCTGCNDCLKMFVSELYFLILSNMLIFFFQFTIGVVISSFFVLFICSLSSTGVLVVFLNVRCN